MVMEHAVNKLFIKKKHTHTHTHRYIYVVLPKNLGNLNRVPEPVVICSSTTRCG